MIGFKRIEVLGATKEEALEKAPFNTIMKNATQAYNNWKEKMVNGITDTDIKQFMFNYIEKESKCAPGVGFYIVEESAVKDTRKRPYTKNDIKNDKGARKWQTIIQIYENLGTAENPILGELLIENAGNKKSEASNKAKELYADKTFRKNIVARYTKQVTKGEPIAFSMDYTPSKSSQMGRYLVFGIESL